MQCQWEGVSRYLRERERESKNAAVVWGSVARRAKLAPRDTRSDTVSVYAITKVAVPVIFLTRPPAFTLLVSWTVYSHWKVWAMTVTASSR